MKKFFLIATGIYMLILGLVLSLSSLIAYFLPRSLEQTAVVSPLLILLTNMPVIIWLFSTGIGLFFKKNWARISILVMSVLAIVVGIIVCLFIGLMALPEVGMDDSAMLAFKGVMLGIMSVFLIVLPIVYLVFFTRKSVKEIFNGGSGDQTVSRRPIGISILAILSLFSGFFSIIPLFVHTYTSIPVFGFSLSGMYLNVYLLVMAVLNLYIAFGFWRLHKPAWAVGLGIYGFGLVATIYNLIFTDSAEFSRLMGNGNPNYVMDSMAFKGMFAFSCIWGLLVMAYLFSQRSVFAGSDALNQVTQTESEPFNE